MAQKLNLMESSKFWGLGFVLCLWGFISCGNVQSNETKKEVSLKNQDVVLADSVQEISTFEPDSTVNGILVLNNQESSKRFYPKISSKKLINFLRESPVLAFSDREQKVYLLLYQYEGGVKNEFSCIEIAHTNDLKQDMTVTDYDGFKTESGLELGMSFEELIKIKGKSYVRNGDKIIYRIDDYSKSDFLKRYNMPAYFLECTLVNDDIVKIKFGFEYP